ncbi:MAG TPA: hypothetical protein EYQ31_03215 [Candidatus Handelsmanbacteria bacterium]|nr:hypothetical protein [Candidatus Handelsmanbacteria bacterium]
MEALDLSGTRTLSSRMLETLAVCPRRYLLRDVLGVVPPRMPEYDPRRWLHPLEMGNLLHGLFLDFMREIRQRGERPGAGHEALRQELVEATIAAERQRVPVTLEAGYRNDCRRIERASRIFLAAEALKSSLVSVMARLSRSGSPTRSPFGCVVASTVSMVCEMPLEKQRRTRSGTTRRGALSTMMPPTWHRVGGHCNGPSTHMRCHTSCRTKDTCALAATFLPVTAVPASVSAMHHQLATNWRRC